MSESTTTTCKVSYRGTVRRVVLKVPAKWQLFTEQLRTINGVPNARLCVQYTDEEGDVITLNTDEELQDALDLHSAIGRPVRFELLTLDEAYTTNPSASTIPITAVSASSSTAPSVVQDLTSTHLDSFQRSLESTSQHTASEHSFAQHQQPHQQQHHNRYGSVQSDDVSLIELEDGIDQEAAEQQQEEEYKSQTTDLAQSIHTATTLGASTPQVQSQMEGLDAFEREQAMLEAYKLEAPVFASSVLTTQVADQQDQVDNNDMKSEVSHTISSPGTIREETPAVYTAPVAEFESMNIEPSTAAEAATAAFGAFVSEHIKEEDDVMMESQDSLESFHDAPADKVEDADVADADPEDADIAEADPEVPEAREFASASASASTSTSDRPSNNGGDEALIDQIQHLIVEFQHVIQNNPQLVDLVKSILAKVASNVKVNVESFASSLQAHAAQAAQAASTHAQSATSQAREAARDAQYAAAEATFHARRTASEAQADARKAAEDAFGNIPGCPFGSNSDVPFGNPFGGRFPFGGRGGFPPAGDCADGPTSSSTQTPHGRNPFHAFFGGMRMPPMPPMPPMPQMPGMPPHPGMHHPHHPFMHGPHRGGHHGHHGHRRGGHHGGPFGSNPFPPPSPPPACPPSPTVNKDCKCTDEELCESCRVLYSDSFFDSDAVPPPPPHEWGFGGRGGRGGFGFGGRGGRGGFGCGGRGGAGFGGRGGRGGFFFGGPPGRAHTMGPTAGGRCPSPSSNPFGGSFPFKHSNMFSFGPSVDDTRADPEAASTTATAATETVDTECESKKSAEKKDKGKQPARTDSTSSASSSSAAMPGSFPGEEPTSQDKPGWVWGLLPESAAKDHHQPPSTAAKYGWVWNDIGGEKTQLPEDENTAGGPNSEPTPLYSPLITADEKALSDEEMPPYYGLLSRAGSTSTGPRHPKHPNHGLNRAHTIGGYGSRSPRHQLQPQQSDVALDNAKRNATAALESAYEERRKAHQLQYEHQKSRLAEMAAARENSVKQQEQARRNAETARQNQEAARRQQAWTRVANLVSKSRPHSHIGSFAGASSSSSSTSTAHAGLAPTTSATGATTATTTTTVGAGSLAGIWPQTVPEQTTTTTTTTSSVPGGFPTTTATTTRPVSYIDSWGSSTNTHTRQPIVTSQPQQQPQAPMPMPLPPRPTVATTPTVASLPAAPVPLTSTTNAPASTTAAVVETTTAEDVEMNPFLDPWEFEQEVQVLVNMGFPDTPNLRSHVREFGGEIEAIVDFLLTH